MPWDQGRRIACWCFGNQPYSDATYVVEWKPALKCVNARLIFLTLTINAIKKINCLAALLLSHLYLFYMLECQ